MREKVEKELKDKNKKLKNNNKKLIMYNMQNQKLNQ